MIPVLGIVGNLAVGITAWVVEAHILAVVSLVFAACWAYVAWVLR